MTAALFSPAMLVDPYPTYAALRRTDPVHWHEPFGAWVLTRYDDVVAATHDPRLRSDRAGGMGERAGRPELQPLFEVIGAQMNITNPERHHRLRALVAKVFTPRAVDALRPAVAAMVNELLDRLPEQGRFDVIADLAFPLPARVIARLLGLDTGELEQLKRWSDDFSAIFGTDPSAVTPEQYQRALQSTHELTTFFRAEFEKRRASPGDDLLSLLVHAEIDGDRLSETELIANANLLLAAGHETTTHLIGNGLLALLHHPDQLQLLLDEPFLIPNAIEEFLRYDGTVQFMYREAGEELTIGERSIRKGQLVYLMFAAANRDPARFPDPDRLDVRRRLDVHLAFGHGPHVCLGAALARMEAQVAFTALLRRCSGLQLTDEPLAYQDNLELRGLKGLPVVFERRSA
ncbi:cytochrome P450 [Cyanobium sp. Candia 9D4]|uniref:cytochrome P450 n=1 Tax=Cyanobium sp. Candia 9D4 TaxID=2823707 RepID=UPI0020CBD353|nr:cytochrome P450 [Cyanobium sp. Candia 9D4]MCP9933121.1 cytochrome P450 [Cyanobium sp. Candia 9D4]